MKLKVKDMRRFFKFLTVIITAACFFYVSSSSVTYSSQAPKKITVGQGDTLWHITEKHYPDEYLPKKTFEIAELNNLNDGTIYPGQILILP